MVPGQEPRPFCIAPETTGVAAPDRVAAVDRPDPTATRSIAPDPRRTPRCPRSSTKSSHANAAYADSFGAKADLALPPARRFAILTCMDARLDPAKYAGLSEGDAHVIRNAGGRASDDAIRSLVISYKLLGTAEWFVIHHTDCGMEFFTNEVDQRSAREQP